MAMPSWDVVNGAPLQWKLAEGRLFLLVILNDSSLIGILYTVPRMRRLMLAGKLWC